MRRRRVLVLMHEDTLPPDSLEGLDEAEVHRIKAEYDVTWALEQLGHEVLKLGVKSELAPIRAAIEEFRPHLAFNLLLHFHDVVSYDSYVVSYLELLKTAYTGCNPRGLLLASDKALAKKILNWHRIRVPRFVLVRRGSRPRVPKGADFPLFVKSAVEHASFGISQASIVKSPEALAERVEFVHGYTGTDAVVEEYIPGRELYVGVLGNQRLNVLPVWEMTFRELPDSTEPIATSRVKWNLEYQRKIGVETGPAGDLPAELEVEIARTARRIYRALGLSGYARIDLRLAQDGRVYVLEANPNPDLSLDEDLARSAQATGLEYPALIQRLLSLGLRYRPAWKEE